MISASDPLARTPRVSALAILTLAAAFAMTACGQATPGICVPLRPVITPTIAADCPRRRSAPVPGDGWLRLLSDGNTRSLRTPMAPKRRCCRRSPKVSIPPDGATSVVVQSPQGSFCRPEPDGSGYMRLASPDPTLKLGCFAWSPDASRLACEGWDDSDAARNGIYTVRASDGGGLTRVTTSTGGDHDVIGDYSPDGRQIVFLRDNLVDEQHNTLMVVNVDGSDPRVLTDRKVGLASRWSPDGKMILTESDGSLLLVPLDGGQPTPIRIDAYSAMKATRGAWSLDGTWIVFSRVTSTGEDISIMRNDGTNLHQVTDTPGQDEEFGEWGVPAP